MGDDTLYGGAGDDILYGDGEGGEGQGNDTLYGGAGADTISGMRGNDELHGDEGNDSLWGNDGNDTLYGGAGDDALYGGAGDDILVGGAGDDSLSGSAGANTFVFAPGGGNDFVEDFKLGMDKIDLSGFDGFLFTNMAIRAGDSHRDTVIDLGAYGTTITLKNVSFVDVRASDFILPERATEGDDIVSLVDTGEVFSALGGDDTVYGGRGDDQIYGLGGDDELHGGEGDDIVHGHGGDDTLYGGAGNDKLQGKTGDDTLHGGAGDDTLVGGPGADSFVFEPDHGHDVIMDFTPGQDSIDLSAFSSIQDTGNLTLRTEGADTVLDLSAHGGGTVTLKGVSLSDLGGRDFGLPGVALGDGVEGTFRSGGDGRDFFSGGEGDDELHGGAGNDSLMGRGGDDRLVGGRGDDSLYGGAGDDTIIGGKGDDTLTGNAGADSFVFKPGQGNDLINDFSNGEDLIDLSAYTGITGIGNLTITQEGNHARIDAGQDTIRLLNFDVADLDASDFVFHEAQVDGM